MSATVVTPTATATAAATATATAAPAAATTAATAVAATAAAAAAAAAAPLSLWQSLPRVVADPGAVARVDNARACNRLDWTRTAASEADIKTSSQACAEGAHWGCPDGSY
eukprot:5489588-Alexandrium_andersonii.AAC.1